MEDLYVKAAETVRNYIKLTHFSFSASIEDIQQAYKSFQERFGPEQLKALPDAELLRSMFLSVEGDNTSLCYYLEFDSKIKSYFGSISGGSSFKYGLFQRQEDNQWVTGAPSSPEVLSEEDALRLGKQIRDSVIAGCDLIGKSNLVSIEEYAALDKSLNEIMGKISGFAWVQKYFHMIFPDKFVSWYVSSWIDHYLLAFGIKPEDKQYVKNGQLNLIRKHTELPAPHFGEVCYKMFGNVRHFYRLGSSDDSGNYADEWRSKGLVAIGWNETDDLVEYLKNGSIDKKELATKLASLYPSMDKKTASRKAGEMKRFYEAANTDIFVVMDGEKLIAMVDAISPYFYDDSEHMAHCRRGSWKMKFTDGEKLPESEGQLTTCYELTKGANRLFLYKKYFDALSTEGIQNSMTDQSTVVYKTNLKTDFELNRILFGAPGTGKSYLLNSERIKLLGENNEADYERVTFHPDYAYANFVGTYKPVPAGDVITYEYVPGPFMRVYVNALRNGRTANVRPFLLIIEEINRANVAAVFGDIFQLLDRDDDNVSEYPIQATEDMKKYLAKELGGDKEDFSKIRIPNNMFLWATMNSADQGVFPMDTAFKRRWDFTYIGINDGEGGIAGKTVTLGKNDNARIVEWNSFRRAINECLSSFRINEDKLLGPYFLSRKVVPQDSEIIPEIFINAFKNKVLMYLFDDAGKQKRSSLFAEDVDSTKYSEVCRAFETKGIFAFCTEISSAVNATIPDEREKQ
ncbi:AAA family ATPase [Succiniclasticum ruminis]|uniref:5-methylcytosine-specific restriction enzyme B n=1 Tax=Succiniclasticum ruminis DSM 9236 TaxID=1123323 RepID=A0A1I2BZH5_9FIRM|nr:AAA family ATPase [Succiniclasticum ruminis]SFE61332.1 5-methylcytosine-specific restriction enzyme B [Succiniclasticum ruminis DSM 9236]